MSGDATSFVWADVLNHIVAGNDLDEQTAGAAMSAIMRGEASEAEIAAFLVALRAKGESATEIAAFVGVMIDNATDIDVGGPLLDTCGTGGDGANTFNISTLAAVVCAAAGVRVAKHGNRSASSVCGSADLLEAWGVQFEIPPALSAQLLEEIGIAFLYARAFHPAMRHVGPVRSSLGIRTVFNILGPLSNPAGAEHQVIGVADERLAPVIADALARLDKRHVLVFRSQDGLDELSTTGPSRLWEVRDGTVMESVFEPADLGLRSASLSDLHAATLAENVAMAESVLSGDEGPAADVVVLNAAAGLYVAGAADSIGGGLEAARSTLQNGAARDLRDRWVARSTELAAMVDDAARV